MKPEDVEKLAKRAFEAFMAEKHVLGLALTDQLIEAVPTNATFRCWQVYGLLDGGQPQEAVEAARRAVQVAPGAFETHLVLAQSLWTCDNPNEAQREFEQAISLSRGHPYVLSEYASFLAIDRDAADAHRVAEEAIKANPNSADAWAALGVAQYRLQRIPEAKSSLRRSLELNPASNRAALAMQAVLSEVARRKGAAALRDMIKDIPEAGQLAAELCRQVQRREEAWSEAAEDEAETVSRRPNSARLRRAWYIAIAVLLALATGAVVRHYL
jgi:Tfp pilus assembly protein PilF